MENIYLITSSSYRLLEEEVKKIVKDNPYVSFDLNYQTMEDVLDEANYYSLFDDKKYIVVKNSIIFTSPKKKDEGDDSVSKKDEILLKYLESPNYNTVLIFTLNGKATGTKKIVKTIKDKYNYIEIVNLKVRDLYDKVEALLKSKGYKADKNAIYYIINNSLNNYDLAYNEVEKIDLYYKKGRSLSIDDVTNIVSRVMEDNNFKFIDAVMSRNIKEIFKIYDDLMLQKVEPLMLLAMIAKELRNSLLVKLLDGNKNEMMRTLGVKYEFQLDKWLNYSYTFTDVFLENKLIELADLNYKIKSGKVSSKLGLQLFLLDFCK